MKKLIVCSLLAFSFTMTMAQRYEMPRARPPKVVSLTFIASPQVSWMKSASSDVIDGKNRLGFAYGVVGDMFLRSDRYSFLTGLTVSSLGGTLRYRTAVFFSNKLLPVGTSVNYHLRYLEIPLVLKMRSKDFNRSRFYAQFGLNNWLNIKARATTSDGSFYDDSVNDEVRLFNIGLNVGGGIDYDVGNRNYLTAGLVYTGTFFDTTKNQTVEDITTLNALRIRLGFVF